MSARWPIADGGMAYDGLVWINKKAIRVDRTAEGHLRRGEQIDRPFTIAG